MNDFPSCLFPKKPLLRGKLHRVSQFVILIMGPIHVACFGGDSLGRAALAVFYLTNLTLYFVSSIYHLNYWRSDTLDVRVTQADHACIFMVIGGCYAGYLFLNARSMPHVFTLLWAVWILVFVGILKCIIHDNLHRMLNLLFYGIVTFICLPFIPSILRHSEVSQGTLLVCSLLSFLAGGVAYGLKYPDPNPKIFRYHEMFHVFQVIGVNFMLASYMYQYILYQLRSLKIYS